MSANKIVSYTQYIDYAKAIAASHKLLNPNNSSEPNFYEFSEELVGNKLEFPCMVIPPEDYDVRDTGDNAFLWINGEFLIMKDAIKGDPENNKDVLQTCFDIAWDVLSQFKFDREQFLQANGRYLAEFDLNTVKITQLMPMTNDYALGYRVSFSFGNPKHLVKSGNFW